MEVLTTGGVKAGDTQAVRERVHGLLGAASKGGWIWRADDESLASLTGPSEQEDFVMAVSPCKACADKKEGWAWGKCATPTLGNAMLIASAPALAQELLDALDEIERLKAAQPAV